MAERTFRALVVREEEGGRFVRGVEERRVDELPEGEVLVRVGASSLNYKDALSATGNRGVTRHYPHTPGIDAAGVVEACAGEAFRAGDEVIVTGFDLGMNTPGGFGEYIRVPADWVMRRPEGLSLRESMALGTAGFTAGLSVLKLAAHGVQPDAGEVLVTGATGGVGSLAVAILARAGYRVAAATGKPEAEAFLRDLGAASVIRREEATGPEDRPLLKSRWAGAVDSVGGAMLSTAIRSTRYGGAVACCGLAASHELPITVYPFILRGISLLGVDSANCPMPVRAQVWEKLAGAWKVDLERLTSSCTLETLEPEIERILRGGQRGRVVVEMGNER